MRILLALIVLIGFIFPNVTNADVRVKTITTVIVCEVGKNNNDTAVVKKSVRPLVPMDQLANRKLLHWNLTDEQYKMCYDAAVKIAKPLAGIEDRKELVKAVHDSMNAFYSSEVSYSMTEPHFLDAYGFFISKHASCQGASCAVGFVLNVLGIDYEHVNHQKYKHQWCRVKMEDGTYWVCDAMDMFFRQEPAPYRHPSGVA